MWRRLPLDVKLGIYQVPGALAGLWLLRSYFGAEKFPLAVWVPILGIGSLLGAVTMRWLVRRGERRKGG